MKSSLTLRFPIKRLFLLTLVSFVAVAALLGIAASANKANRAAKERAELAANAKSGINPAVQNDKQPQAPLAPVIVATLTDNVTAATKVAPGGTINYTATITNNGAASPADDATNLNFSAPLDANTTLVAGSVHASPIAFNDTYNWVGNTFLDTAARALPAVTANDVAVNAPAGTDTFTVTAIAGGATALGGTVTLASPSGAFTYTPPLGRPNVADGATVQDSFTYTITNNADPTLTGIGTVRVNLTGRVWYLVAGGAGDGRSNTPSGSPAAMSTAADKSTDFFYIFSNAGSLNGPFSVDAGQQLLGQGVSLVVSSITLFTAAAPTPTTTNTAGSCVTLAGAPGNNTVSGFNIGNCTGGTAITGSNVGTLNVSTMSINTNGGALDLTGVGTPTVSVVLGGTTSTGGARNVNLIGLNGTFTLASGALSGATGNALHVDGGNAGLTYSGTISNSGGRQVNIINKTGGTVDLSGAIGGTGTGIFLNANNGATLNFTGGIALSTGTNAAFTATGPGPAATTGGTVNVTQNNTTIVNTLASTTGTALNVANTTIGGSGLTFRSISSDGAANGIVLNNTGAGTLTVSGNGGSCTSTATCTGGAIQNSTNHAVSLTSTTSPSFTRIAIQNAARSGIDGQQVTNFTLANSFIDNVGTGAAGQHDESNISFNDNGLFTATTLSGTVSITNNTLSNARRHGIQIENGSGTISNLTVSNNTLTSSTNATVSLGTGILVLQQGSASTTAHLTTGTISNNAVNNFPSAEGIAILGGSGNASNNTSQTFGANGTPINITSNTINGGATRMGSNAIRVSFNGQVGVSNFNISCNGNTNAGAGCSATGPLTNFQGLGISTFFGGTVTGTTTVDNNVVVSNQTIGAGSSGIAVQADDGPSGLGTSDPNVNVTINNNNVSANEGNGIRAIARATNRATMDLTIQNNTVTAPTLTNRNGIRVDSGSAAGDTNLCLVMTGNASAGSGVNQGIGIRKQGTNAVVNVFGITGLVPSPTTGANAAAKLAADNPAGNGVDVLSGDNFVSCTQTPIPPPGDEGAMNTSARPNAGTVLSGAEFWTPSKLGAVTTATAPVIERQQTTVSAKARQAENEVKQATSSVRNSWVIGKATPKASAAEVARIYRSERPISHHAVRSIKNAFSQDPNAPTSGETVTLNTIAIFPAAGKSITIKYSATVNTPPLARQVSTQGTVSGSNFASVLTDDPEPGGAADPTVTLIDTLVTWNGSTNTDWNTATNWTPPAGGTQYAPGVSNPAINDVVIPNVGAQPNISATDIGIFSLNISNGRTLTITNPRVLTIGGSPGGDLTLDGIISGGNLNLGTGTHVINNAGGTGSLSSTNVATVLSGSTVTLNNNLQAGALAVNAGGSMTIANRTLSLNGSGAALAIAGGATFTTTGSTIVFNGTAAQQAAGIAYNNLTINNSIGLNVTGVTLTGNATVNGALALTSSDLDTGAFTLTQPNTTASTGVSDVVGTITRTAAFGTTTITFGNPNNQITFGAAGTKPTSLTVVMAKTPPATYAAAVQRNYTISQVGPNTSTATVRLHYLDSEVTGLNSEATLNLRRLRTSDSRWVAQLPTTRDTVANWVESNAVAGADLPTQWTFSSLAPTASDGVVTGRIVDDQGMPVEGAVVRLEGTQNRKFITDANGFYRFNNVETSGFYTVTPSRVNYVFNPQTRSFSLLGETTEAIFGATRTDGTVNPLDTPEYFVRQHYLDFLGREPDEAGFNFWSDQILGCAIDNVCIERKRENVSAAYFLSIEFQRTGGLVDGLYRASYGVRPEFAQFMPDTRAVGLGVQVGNEGWEATLNANKAAFVAAFVNRPAFRALYDGMDHSVFVETLIGHTGVSFTPSERDALVSGLTTGTMTRADVLRSIAENERFVNAKFNEAFVMMEYFGYLRRDADASGYDFWLDKLIRFGGNFEQAEMVKAFIVSTEYRNRFPR
jgi:uncharacterized protein DUF4214